MTGMSHREMRSASGAGVPEVGERDGVGLGEDDRLRLLPVTASRRDGAVDGLELVQTVERVHSSSFVGIDLSFGIVDWSRRHRRLRGGGSSAAPQLGTEGVEPLRPEGPELREPHVQLLQRSGVNRIDPPGAFGADRREPVVPQHLQVLRDGRVRDAELVADGPRQLT